MIYVDTLKKPYFDYDVKNDKPVLCSKSTRTEETIIYNFPTPQTITPTGSIKVTAILPPITINADNPITITLDAKEGTGIAKFSTDVTAGHKAIIKTGNWKALQPQTIDAVDLGLSVKWAAWNLDATKPEDYGNYYPWACTVQYASSADVNDWKLYWTRLGSNGTAEADCAKQGIDPLYDYFRPIRKSIAGTEWDIARYKLGGTWRLPTKEEAYELLEKCDWIWTDGYNDTKTKGYIVKSKTNDNHIFIPAAGQHNYATRKLYAGNNGYYWVGHPSDTYTQNGSVIFFALEDDRTTRTISFGSFKRRNGFTVRPVLPY